MTDIADARPLVARRSWRKPVIGSTIMLLVAAAWIGWRAAQGDHPPWIVPGLAAAWCVLGLPFLIHDRVPRLIIAADALSWRDARKEPLYFLAWSRILSAKFEDRGEDGHMLLLILTPPPVVEQQASGRTAPFVVDIEVGGLDISRNVLRTAIRRRAPHLFGGAQQNAA
ncbi:hypothetical protein AS593_21360 [Caulobacter vibrioides]|nr:hypothetical protein AS593_21360 [Caulobacter vibrioides]